MLVLLSICSPESVQLHGGAHNATNADLRQEAGIGRCASGCHGRQSSMLHNIGGARTRAFFALISRWQSDVYSATLVSDTFFRVEEYFGLIRYGLKPIAVNVSFLHLSQNRSYNLSLHKRYDVSHKACFLPLECM